MTEAKLQPWLDISTHAPRTGSDPAAEAVSGCCRTFQPTLPARGATPTCVQNLLRSTFQPTLPARGATWSSRRVASRHNAFQPTLPARGATAKRPAGCRACGHFNPRSPHGERQALASAAPHPAHFNPRSPHGERRLLLQDADGYSGRISTHAPRTGSDQQKCCAIISIQQISTHAPRTGSDALSCKFSKVLAHFNPRSPHGERRPPSCKGVRHLAFQPTLPARGATAQCAAHHPRAGHFNPRSPHGERRHRHPCSSGAVPISTHAPRTGSDGGRSTTRSRGLLFQPTLPARGATRSAASIASMR